MPANHPTPPCSIAEVCGLPKRARATLFSTLIPSDLLEQLSLSESADWTDTGTGVLRWFLLPDGGGLRLEVWPDPSGEDPALALGLADTRDGNLEAGWIVLNDISGSRFHLDSGPRGSTLAIGGAERNLEEELRALAAGLAPNQVRPGLRLFRPLIERVEALAREMGKTHLYVIPLAYHNAIKYEHYGFDYTGDPKELVWIDREFRPGGRLRRRMDGDRPFRQPWMADTIRGRSWAIRDGVLGRRWTAPRMVKDLDDPGSRNTFPGGRW